MRTSGVDGWAARLPTMKALFTEIRVGAYDAVAARLDRDASLVHVIAKSPPKKDDGQSTLQVAIKSAQFDIAHLLLDRGADATFIDASAVNAWHAPVLHDAIRAAVFSSRFGRNRAQPGKPPKIEVMNTLGDLDRAFAVLARVIELGADPNATDSLGNPALMRAALDARQVLDEPALPDLAEDLERVFALLRHAGSNFEWVDPRFGIPIREHYAGEPVGRFLATTQ